jgi:sugar lactone lactonase YvrE
MPEPQTLKTGLALGESPRWHDDRLWFSNWGAQEVVAVDLEGESEVIVRLPSFPFCLDWLGHRLDFAISGGPVDGSLGAR